MQKLLPWLKNFFGEHILENIFKSAIFKVLTILGQLFLIPLTIGILDKEAFGVWVTIATIINWMTFFDFGVGNGLRNKLVESLAAGDTVKSKKLISTAYAFTALVCAGIALLYLLIGTFFSYSTSWFKYALSTENISAALSMAVYLFLIRFFLMTVTFLNYAKQKSGINDILQFWNIALTIAVLVVLKFTMQLHLSDVVLVYCIIPILVYGVYSFIFFSRNKNLTPHYKAVDKKLAPELMSVGMSFFFIQIVTMLLITFPVFIINKWYGATYVTEYNIAARLYGAVYMGLTVILTPYWSAITKAAAENNTAWLRTTLVKMQKVSYVFIAFIVLLFVLSQFIYKLWIGDAVSISFNMNLAPALYNIALLLIAPLNYYQNGKSTLQMQVFLSVINVILYFPAIQIFSSVLDFGAPGIIYASFFILMVNYILTYLFITRPQTHAAVSA